MKTKTLGIFALVAVGLLLTAGIVSAGGFSEARAKFAHKGMMLWKDKAVWEAVEDNDYEAWKAAVGEQVNEEKFNHMREKFQAKAEYKAAMEPVHAAIEAGDYEAWKAATANLEKPSKFADKITEENFDTLIKLHEAKQNKDFETAKELMNELGVDYGKKFEGRMHKMHAR